MHRHGEGRGWFLQDCSFWNSQWIKAAAAMAINYSICFPYCLSLLTSVALRRCCATSASARMLQRNARVLGWDVPPAPLRSGRPGGERGRSPPGAPQIGAARQAMGRASARPFPWDAGLNASRRAERGSRAPLRPLVSAVGQDWENAAD